MCFCVGVPLEAKRRCQIPWVLGTGCWSSKQQTLLTTEQPLQSPIRLLYECVCMCTYMCVYMKIEAERCAMDCLKS